MALKPILLPKFSNLSAAAQTFFLKEQARLYWGEKEAQNAIFHIKLSGTGSMDLKKPFLDRMHHASPLFLPYANLNVDEANNQEAQRVHPGQVRCII
jgi:hypothetical protein